MLDPNYEVHEDIWWSLVQVDEDRYSGAYSGYAYTAWRGPRPSDIDAGDIDCHKFWQNRSSEFGGGATPQEAFRDLLAKTDAAGMAFEEALEVVMVISFSEDTKAFLFGSQEFSDWLAAG